MPLTMLGSVTKIYVAALVLQLTGEGAVSPGDPERSCPSSAPWQHGQMGREHRYQATVTWTGNLGKGTAGHRLYSRDHEVAGEGKPPLPGSSDASFGGDAARWNPEELLVAALSQCHMLWFLHLCAVNGIVVTSYADHAQGIMTEGGDGGGEFTAVTLRPMAAIADSSQAGRALELHEEAHRLCFIARSVNFPVSCEPVLEGQEK